MAESRSRQSKPTVTRKELGTPIHRMVVPELAEVLEPYSKLTRGDLLALAGIGRTESAKPEEFGLEVTDVHRIRDVFLVQQEIDMIRNRGDELSITIKNCCCCPCSCCCAAVEPNPVLPLS